MSDDLMELIDAEFQLCKSKSDAEELLTIAVISWNAALLDDADRVSYLEELAPTIPRHRRAEFPSVVGVLIERKRKLFPKLQRPILSFELNGWSEGQPRLTVLSELT